MLLDLFVNGLDHGTDCAITKFAGDIKLGGVTDIPEAAILHVRETLTDWKLFREESHEVQKGEMQSSASWGE